MLLVIGSLVALALGIAIGKIGVTLVVDANATPAPAISCQEIAYTNFDKGSPGAEAIQHLNEVAGAGSVGMNREGPNTFGPEVLTTDIESVRKTLSAIRLCENGNYVDSHIMAVHMATWTQELKKVGVEVAHPTSLGEVNAFADKLSKDAALRQEVAQELESLEGGSEASIEEAAKGVWSLYMVSLDGVITIHQGQTIQAGPAIAFKHPSGAKVSYRLGCFFQPFGQKEFPGIKIIPPPPPPTTTPSTTPPQTTTPSTPPTTPEEEGSDKIPTEDPAAQSNAPEGGGQNYDPGPGEYVFRSEITPPPQVYIPPAAPAPAPGPGLTADPAPAPPPIVDTPITEQPATGCNIPPGKTSC